MSIVIGISGVARSGKDTFASILTNQLKAAGKSVEKFAFADTLKQDCDEFCKSHLGVSAFTSITEEKNLIRPMLVWFGDAKRKQTEGRYWVDIIDKKVKASKADFCLITDVRYDFYPVDEIDWVKKECDGLVCHVSRWTKEPLWAEVAIPPETEVKRYLVKTTAKFIPPANDHEALNDPKVKAKSDFIVEWENVSDRTMQQLAVEPSLVAHVTDFITEFKLI